VATVSRIDKIIGLFCRILSLLQVSFAKETYNLIDPTDQSHPIAPNTYSVKLNDSFAKYSLFYRALLQKRPVILVWYAICSVLQCVAVSNEYRANY